VSQDKLRGTTVINMRFIYPTFSHFVHRYK
jgi:hypothetical protein